MILFIFSFDLLVQLQEQVEDMNIALMLIYLVINLC